MSRSQGPPGNGEARPTTSAPTTNQQTPPTKSVPTVRHGMDRKRQAELLAAFRRAEHSRGRLPGRISYRGWHK